MKLGCDFDKVYVRPGFVDGRKGINSLLGIIANDMKLNPSDNILFMFCTKNRKLLRLVFWQYNAFWFCSKRLDDQLWPWPNTMEEAREINETELHMLLKGIDFWKAHKAKHYDIIV